jgi:hypothetical protein
MLLRAFLFVSALLLALTCLAKFVSVFDEAPALARPDSLFYFLTVRQMLFIVAVLEGWVAWQVFKPSVANRYKLFLILWLAGVFAAYRLGTWWLGHKSACGCMGTLLPLETDTVNALAMGILVFLLCGSTMFLWRESNNPSNSYALNHPELKP